MPADRTITITGMSRPWLFRSLLESLVANKLDGWRLVIRIEPTEAAPEFASIAGKLLSRADVDFVVNDEVLGITMNPLYAIEDAFDQGSRLNIYLEEDMLVSPDLTTLAAWYAAEHRPNWLCLNLIAGPCGSAGLLSNAAFPEQLFEARTFNSLGFVMRPEEWEAHAREAWLGKPGPAGVTSIHARWRWSWGWDWSLYGLVAEGSLLSVQPVLARATHTGREGGVHASPRFHDAAFGKLPINRRRRLRYRLTDVEALPQDVRAHVYLQEEITAMRLQMEAAVTGNDATQTTVPQLRPAPPPANQPEPAGKLRKLRHTLGRMRRGGA